MPGEALSNNQLDHIGEAARQWWRLADEYRVFCGLRNPQTPIADAVRFSTLTTEFRRATHYLSCAAEGMEVEATGLLAFLDRPDPFEKLSAARVVMQRLACKIISAKARAAVGAAEGQTPADRPTDPPVAAGTARPDSSLPAPPMPDPDCHLSVSEAAKLLSVSRETVERKITRGELPAKDMGNGGQHCYRIRRGDLDQYMNAKAGAASKAAPARNSHRRSGRRPSAYKPQVLGA